MNEPLLGLQGHWTLFTKDNSPLPDEYVLAPFIAVCGDQVWVSVWISQGLGVPARAYGLFLTDGQDWTEYRSGSHGLPTEPTGCMAADIHNRLWLSAPHAGICAFDGRSAVMHGFGKHGLPEHVVVTDLCIDGLTRVWVATLGHGVYRFADNEWRKLAHDPGALSDYIVSLEVDHENHLWLACQDREETRFLSSRSGSWEIVTSLPIGLKHEDEVSCFAVDRDDRIWVGRRSMGLLVWDGQGWHKLTEGECPLLCGEIQDAAIDEFDNLWVGTAGGYVVFDGHDWHDWGAIHLGSQDRPMSRSVLLSADSITVSQYVYVGGFVAVDGTGRKWLGSEKGLVMFTPQSRQQVQGEMVLG